MYTSTELQLLRNANPGVQIPGIDTSTGNSLSASSLTPLSALTTDPSAPIYYRPSVNTVVVQQAGADLNGYDFGDASVTVNADDVTIENSTFTATSGYSAIQVDPGYADTTVTHVTFDSGGVPSELAAWVISNGKVDVTDNHFIDTPSDGVDVTGGGVISGNYFAGGGYTSNGGHPDAIWITDSTTPMSVTGNFIDWTPNAGSNHGANDCVRITTEKGSVSNVRVSGNYLFGGTYNVDAGNMGTDGAFSDISVTGNDMGFSQYGAFYPGPNAGVTATANVVLDYTNPAYSASAWSAYEAAGLPTSNLLDSSDGAAISAASETGPTTLYGSPKAVLEGGPYECNFVGGPGSQYIWCASGANIFTYLSPSDSTPSAEDHITNFDPAKDVVDLSNIDASVTPGVSQGFRFVGSNAFTGAGGEVRYQQNTANDTTDIQIALEGDTTPDMQIEIDTLVTPTAANFALTASQSTADMAAGAALSVSPAGAWPMNEYQYTGVRGRAYSSYASVYVDNTLVADDLDLSASKGELDLMSVANTASDSVTVTRGNSQESITGNAVGKTLDLAYHANETIQAGNAGASETFAFGTGFGNVTIDGFSASGRNADRLQLSAAAFSYLTPGMTQAQDLAAVIANATRGANGTTITDSGGDRLTLAGLAATTLAAHPSAVKFV